MSFKVQCPSCEAPVLIKNPKLIGTKVECPKCKYRFKVEEPAAATAATATAGATGSASAAPAAPAEKDKKADKKADKKVKAGGGKNKKLVPVVAGAVALVVLIGGGIAFFGGGKKSDKTFNSKAGLTTGSGNPDGTPEEDPNNPAKKVEPVVPGIPTSTAVTTNLLPGQAVSVYRVNVEQSRGTPTYLALVDQPMVSMFQGTLGFSPNDIETYVHCFAGDGRDPFGVVKLKAPAKAPDRLARMPLKPKPKAVKGRDLHEFRSAPLLHAISNALAMRSLFGDLYAALPMAPATPPKEKPFGVCVYDTQHVLIGEYALLERFLGELGDNGYPTFQSELEVVTLPPQPAPGMGTDGMPTTPPMPDVALTPPKPAPKTPPGKEPNPGPVLYSTVDAFRTVDPTLKRALDEMDADRVNRPLMLYAERFDARHYDPKLMKKEYQLLATTLDPIASRLRYVAANVTAFGYTRFVAHVRLTLADISDVRSLAKEKVAPGLATVTEVLKLFLTTPIAFRDGTIPGAVLPGTGPGFPPGGMGSEGTGVPGGMGSPGGMSIPPGGVGIPPGGMGFPGGMGSPGGPPRPGGGGGLAGPGEGVEGGPGGQGLMGMGQPGMGVGPNGEPPVLPPSHIDLTQSDTNLFITVDLSWSDAVYREVIGPRLLGLANQIKGKMAVFSAESGPHTLAMAGPKALETAKTTPRGTVERAKTDSSRLGLDYPPIQRVSLFVDLLPHLGRGGLANRVNRNAAWYAREYAPVNPNNPNATPQLVVDNVTPGGEWVPELLVPTYPQSAWRAVSPYAPDHTFGATNYVAIAGTGLDVARADPNSADPVVKKKLGMTGYNWGSRAEDVTDGLANTIYLMQTPPGLQQPWIAGGGATARGFNEDDPMSGFRYTNGGKPGVYALMGDGSVRFVPANIDKKVLLALGTRAGGDGADLADVNLAAPLFDPPKPAPKLVVAKPVEPKPVEKKPEDKKPEDKKDTTEKKDPDPAEKKDAVPVPREKKM